MYYIVNKTRNKIFTCKGSFPITILDRMLKEQENLIVISTYSNTVKVPYELEENGTIYWDWEDYPIKDYLKHYQ